MKGYNASAASAPPGKRRWKGLAMGVFVLVVFSLLVPLAFLLGLHNRSGYFTDDREQPEANFENYRHIDHIQEQKPSEGDDSRIKELVKKLALPPPLLQDVAQSGILQTNEDSQEKMRTDFTSHGAESKSQPKDVTSHPEPKNVRSTIKGHSPERIFAPKVPLSSSIEVDHAKDSTADEAGSYCQVEFGSYCLWSRQHKEVMKDTIVKRLKDQLFVARAYYPSIAKIQGKEQLTLELKMNIQEHERMLSEAISDPDLPALVMKNIQKMDEIIAKAKSCAVDCNNVDRKFRQLVDLTEDEAHFHMKQSAFLYQLGVQTMSKSFHCLSMRLTVEYFRSPEMDIEQTHAHKLDNPSFQHYIIFSRNILAASVTINSTVVNSEETDIMVFHVITDRQNFYSMKLWFARNSYNEATVHVLNFDDIKMDSFYDVGPEQLLPSEEFHISIRSNAQPSSLQMRTDYISVFGHSHFLLPEIFKNLKKVIILDDDVVVQRDLQSLWNLDLGGKVNGAVEFCRVRLGQLKSYLGSNSYDGNSCLWMSGLNVVDLEKWREHNLTRIYQNFLHELKTYDDTLWRAASLPRSLLAFGNQIYALDDTWIQSGLGHDYGVEADTISNAVALHYNGNMKPWLDLGIPKYKKYWKNYLTQGERFMDECNVNL